MTEIKADVTGNVWKIGVVAGQRVAAGDPLVILESMKMEIPHTAPRDATVKAVHVSEGDHVDEGALILTLE